MTVKIVDEVCVSFRHTFLLSRTLFVLLAQYFGKYKGFGSLHFLLRMVTYQKMLFDWRFFDGAIE